MDTDLPDSPSFTYVPLPNAATHIRLLEIVPGTGDNIDCYYSSHSVADAPGYTALSYTWGDVVPTKTITINSQPLDVRWNCHYALWQIRHYGHTGYIWVDALCINQQDIDEKNHQVQMMGKIYECAEGVLVSLGPEADNSDLVFRFLLADGYHSPPSLDSDRLEDWLLKTNFDRQGVADLWIAICALANRPYWTRVWIVQELMLANRITILCGTEQVRGSLFFGLAQNFVPQIGRAEEYGLAGQAWQDYPYHFLALVSLLRRTPEYYCGREKLDLWNVISNFSASKCFNALDRIYGFLELIKWPEPNWPLSVDYSTSTLQLATECLRRLRDEYQSISEKRDIARFARILLEYLGVNLSHPEIATLIDQRRLPLDEKSPSRNDQESEVLNGLPSSTEVAQLCVSKFKEPSTLR